MKDWKRTGETAIVHRLGRYRISMMRVDQKQIYTAWHCIGSTWVPVKGAEKCATAESAIEKLNLPPIEDEE